MRPNKKLQPVTSLNAPKISNVIRYCFIILLNSYFNRIYAQKETEYNLHYSIFNEKYTNSITSKIIIKNTFGHSVRISKDIFRRLRIGSGCEINFFKVWYTTHPVLTVDRKQGSTGSKTSFSYIMLPIFAHYDLLPVKKPDVLHLVAECNPSFFLFNITSIDTRSALDPFTNETYTVLNAHKFHSGIYMCGRIGVRYRLKRKFFQLTLSSFNAPIYEYEYRYHSPQLSEAYKGRSYGTSVNFSAGFILKSRKERLSEINDSK